MSEKGEKYILESTIISNPNDLVCILPADSEDFQRNIINKPAYVEEKWAVLVRYLMEISL